MLSFTLSFFFAHVAFIVLGVTPQAAVAHFHSIYFSPVQQCGNFSIQFSGGKAPAALPLTLTVVPFNLTPVSVILPPSAWNQTTQTGEAITFLPLPAGTQFVASLDDAQGVGTATVSDVIRIDPSDDTSCLPASPPPPSRYALEGALSQCQVFNVTFDPTTVAPPSMVRGFTPLGPSFFVNQSASDPTTGTVTYVMDAMRDTEVVLMLNDDQGYAADTPLLSVGGDSSSSNGCIPAFSPSGSVTKSRTAGSSSSSGLSKTTIILIAVVSSLVFICIVAALALWYFCVRKRAQRRRGGRLRAANPSALASRYALEKPARSQRDVGQTTAPRRPSHAASILSFGSPFARDPPYTTAAWAVSPITPQAFAAVSPTVQVNRKLDARSSSILSVVDIPVPLVSPFPTGTFPAPSPYSPDGAPSPYRSEPARIPVITTEMPAPSPARTRPSSYGSTSSITSSAINHVLGLGASLPRSYMSGSSVSFGDIEQMLEMATMFTVPGNLDVDTLPRPPPAVINSEVRRNSAYFAGSEPLQSSRVVEATSLSLTSPQPASRRSPTSNRLPVTPSIVQPSANASKSTLSVVTYRQPPQAGIPHSPLTPLPRPSQDGEPDPVETHDARISISSEFPSSSPRPSNGTLNTFHLLRPPGPRRESPV
ncbi:hypothetical protein CERSUDRAFT_112265 [Gelatoporia subvermispora B]|uniref:Dystroglycan-type cadherin-like domain-containing protein n=1 Tax=Ceriporiopsis subvermispora (strain B) TaxID=914234 RepID=M2PTL2_CERS8|nr:hypothetical protein CERSUDRAFT_112265 [Gelatoporia subvermispora B]